MGRRLRGDTVVSIGLHADRQLGRCHHVVRERVAQHVLARLQDELRVAAKSDLTIATRNYCCAGLLGADPDARKANRRHALPIGKVQADQAAGATWRDDFTQCLRAGGHFSRAAGRICLPGSDLLRGGGISGRTQTRC